MLATGNDWLISPWIFAAGVVAALLIALFTRAGWLKLFGPVLFYEVIRAARRDRYFLLRGLYATGLFLLLLWVRWLWGFSRPHDHQVSHDEMAGLAASYFGAYAVVQFIAVVLLTPAYVAGCIADDKERRVLEFLLSTDLANREIIFGKVVARIGNLLLFLLAGLPVLSFVQFFGGIDPAILLLSIGATAVTMLGLTGVSMVNSVQRKRGRDAVLMTYGAAVGYVIISQVLSVFVLIAGNMPNAWPSQAMLAMEPAIDVFSWGDPLKAVFYEFRKVFTTGAGQGQMLLELFTHYASFHMTVFVLGISYSVWRVRAIALRQAGGSDVPRKGSKSRDRRGVSDSPMVWKETVAEGTLKFGWLARLGILILFAAAVVPLGLIVYFSIFERGVSENSAWQQLREGVNGWVRSLNAIITSVMLLGISVRAAGSVGGERDRDTLVSLLTTPLAAKDILMGKFWGAIASVRKLGYLFAAIWLIGLVTGGVHPLAVPVQLIALVPVMCAAASVGLFFSVVCTTTLRALTLTIIGMILGLGGHWMCGSMCCLAPLAMSGARALMEYGTAFAVGMTPAAVFFAVPFEWGARFWTENQAWGFFATAAVGHCVWAGVAAILYSAALDRFTRNTNRGEQMVRMVTLPPAD
jgi:ABC-type transport system involved in multi-copper enzyme maturation permease subunit